MELKALKEDSAREYLIYQNETCQTSVWKFENEKQLFLFSKKNNIKEQKLVTCCQFAKNRKLEQYVSKN